MLSRLFSNYLKIVNKNQIIYYAFCVEFNMLSRLFSNNLKIIKIKDRRLC